MRWKPLFSALFLVVVGGVAQAAPPGVINQYNAVCDPFFPTRCIQPLADGSIDVNATVSASVSGFEPNGDYATLAVTDASDRVALPTGNVVLVQNVGASTAYVNLGDGTVTATTAQIQIPSGGWIALTVGSNVDLAGIADTGESTTLTLVGGQGLATGAVGGSGGGGGGAVTIADGADVAEGAVADAAASAGGTGTVSAKLRTVTSQLGTITTSLGTINTTLGSPMQNSGGSVTANAGTNLNTSALALESGGNLAAIAGDAATLAGTVSAGNINVVCTSGCSGSGGTSSNFGATFPTAGTAAGASDGTNMQPLLVDGSGNLKVAQQGNVTVVGTGTFTVQAAQSGTWNINNISGTVSLPTGASTAAKQPALGTAGTASSDVITVQGIASMTPILVDGTGGTFPISGTVTANQGGSWSVTATQGTAANLNATVVGTGTFAVQAAQSGAWTVSGTGTAGSAATGVLSIQGIASMTPVYTSLRDLGGNAVSAGNGASGTGVLRVTVANDSTGILASIGAISTSVTPGTAAGNLGKAEDAAASSGDTGVMALGVRNQTMASPTSNDGDYGQISLDSIGRVMVTEAAPAAMVRGNATTTGTSDTSLVAASGSGSLKTYVKSCQFTNTGSTTALITLKDGSGGSTLAYTIAPNGAGSNVQYMVPLVTSANTALYFAAGSSSTTVYASCQGYYAP